MNILKEQLFTILATGLLSGLGSGLLTHYLATRRTVSEIRKSNLLKQLENVYLPIIKVIRNGFIPLDGYEGLSHFQVNEIIEIIKNNEQYADTDLDVWAWRFEEEQYIISPNDDSHYYSFDEDGKFKDYVYRRYNLIRKELHLPYDKKVLMPSIIKKAIIFLDNVNRRWIRRRIRKIVNIRKKSV
jgi:hypothetical protein